MSCGGKAEMPVQANRQGIIGGRQPDAGARPGLVEKRMRGFLPCQPLAHDGLNRLAGGKIFSGDLFGDAQCFFPGRPSLIREMAPCDNASCASTILPVSSQSSAT